jgi:cobalt-zinc-cadmium efflux system protein
MDVLAEAMRGVGGVEDVHDLHVWSLSSEVHALSAHVVLGGHPSLEQAQAVGNKVKAAVSAPFGVAHATLELECEGCVDNGSWCAMDALSPPVPGRTPKQR